MIATTIIVTLISSPLSYHIALAQPRGEKRIRQNALAILTRGYKTINATGQFVGNVSETMAENPVVTNATEETQNLCRKR